MPDSSASFPDRRFSVRASFVIALLSGHLLFGMNKVPTLSILAKATSWMEQLRQR